MKAATLLRLLVVALALVPAATAAEAAGAAEGYAAGVRVRVLQRADTTALGQAVRYPDAGYPEVTAVEVTLAPGAETEWHTHPFPGYAYVLEGELLLEGEDGRVARFAAGGTVLESVGLRHNGRNPGKIPVRLVAFFTGAKGKPFSEKAAAPKR